VVKHLVLPVIDPKVCRKIYSNITSEEAVEEVVCDEPTQDDEARQGGGANEVGTSDVSYDDTSCRTVTYNKNVSESIEVTDDMMCAGRMEGGHGNCRVSSNINKIPIPSFFKFGFKLN